MSPTEAYSPDARAAAAETSDDPRIVRALEEYAAALKDGRKPDRQAFLARHPKIAAALAECLDGLDFIQNAAPLLHSSASDSPPGVAGELCPEGPLGDYRLLREIGRGGMGVVYEAVQISLGRQVALKVLPFAATLDDKQLQRFKNEAQAAAQLHHQHIVPIYGVGCARGVHYYAMQFIDGQTLAALIHEMRHPAGTAAAPPGEQTDAYSPAPPAASFQTTPVPGAMISTERGARNPARFHTIARLGVQAAEALEHAHSLGVIHRDVKPANLLVDVRGNLWITDFGLAHCQSQAGLTMTGDLVGTLRYMSPEQALAKRVLVDHRTDIYSLGATLYELLTLEPAFGGIDRQELLRQIAFEEPRPLRRLNKAVPAELETIVLKAIEKNPNERYTSAQELADDLERYLKNETIRAKRPSFLQRMRKWSQRHRSAVWTAGLAAVGFLLMAVVGLAANNVLISQEKRQTDAALEAETKAKRELLKALERERTTLSFSRITVSQHEWLSNNVGRAEEVLEECPAELRHFEWHYLKRLCHLDLLTFRGHKSAVECVAFSRDGKWLASGAMDRSVKVWDASTGREVLTFDAPMWHVRDLAFSPDGTLLAVAGGMMHRDQEINFYSRRLFAAITGRVTVVDARTGVVRYDFLTSFGGGMAFSPDGKYLVCGCLTGILLRDARTGNDPEFLTSSRNPVASVAVSPDSRFVAAAGLFGNVVLWDLANKRETLTLPGHTARVTSVAFSPDGKWVAAGSMDWTVRLWDATTGKPALVPLFHGNGVTSVAFSPDGTRLASASRDQTVICWDTTTGQNLVTLRGHTESVSSLAFSPDGQRIATASWDQTLKLWDPAASKEARLWRNYSAPANSGAVLSPDGQRLATTWRTGKNVDVWDVYSGQKLVNLTARISNRMNSVSFSPDGRFLALNCDNQFVKVCDVTTGREVLTLKEVVHSLALGPAAQVLAARSNGGPVKVRYVPGGEIAFILEQPAKTYTFGTFSLDGRWLAWTDDRTIKLHDGKTGQEHALLAGHTNDVTCMVFSPDSKHLASGGRDQTVKIWDAASGQAVCTLRGHRGVIRHLAYSSDGKRLASWSEDDTVRLWEPAGGREILVLRGQGVVRSLAFSANGHRLMWTRDDASVFLFDATPLSAAKPAEAAARSKE